LPPVMFPGVPVNLGNLTATEPATRLPWWLKVPEMVS
jgi:hypothetical protein